MGDIIHNSVENFYLLLLSDQVPDRKNIEKQYTDKQDNAA